MSSVSLPFKIYFQRILVTLNMRWNVSSPGICAWDMLTLKGNLCSENSLRVLPLPSFKKIKASFFLFSIQHTVLNFFHCQLPPLLGFKLGEQSWEDKGRSAVPHVCPCQSQCNTASKHPQTKKFALPQISFLIKSTNCSFRAHTCLNKLNNCMYKWIENYTHGDLFSYLASAQQRAEMSPSEVNLLTLVTISFW